MTRDGRRAQLVDAARQVFIARGLAGARTKEIAERAGVSEAMLYQHFATKTALFEAAVLGPLEDWAGEMADAGQQMPVTARDGRHEMSFQVHLELFLAMQAMAPLLNSALYHDAEFGTEFYAERLRPLFTNIQSSIENAMAGWAYRGGDAQLITAMTLGTYHWLALQAQFGQPTVETTDIAQRFMEFIMRALEPNQEPLEVSGPRWPMPDPEQPLVSDEVWLLLDPLLPVKTPGRGRHWSDHRTVLEAIAWKRITGLAWRRLPRRFGAWQTAWKRYARWQEDGTWQRLADTIGAAPDHVRQQCSWLLDSEQKETSEL